MKQAEIKNTGPTGNSNFFTNAFLIAILFLGASASLLAFIKLQQIENREIANDLKTHIDEHISAFERRVSIHVEKLKSIRGFFNSSNFVSRAEFSSFTSEVMANHPDITLCEWVRVVSDKERERFEKMVQQEGFKNFQITEVNKEGNIVRAGDREIYYPILYTNPLTPNRKALGLDVGSNPSWLKDIKKSIVARKPFVTEPVHLIQDKTKIISIVVLLPVSSGRNSGFVALIIRPEIIMTGIIPASYKKLGISITLNVDNELLYRNMQDSKSPVIKSLEYTKTINLLGRKWTFSALPNKSFVKSQLGYQPWFVLISGIFLSVILALYINSLQRKSAEIAQLVDERTAELEKAHKQLLHSEKLSAIGRLSASIAHEFNNPLYGITNVIKGIQRRTSLSDNDSILIIMAEKECHRMKELIRDLQEFNRPTSGQFGFVDIHQTIDHILLLCKKEITNHEIKLIKKFTREKLPQIWAIGDQIKQVILNLVNNAIDACTKDDTIEIRTDVQGKEIIVEISDNGHGIKEEDLEHIFEPFFTTKPQIKGTGLGLSVSYGIVKKHGGDLMVKSKYYEGTTFTLSLPVKGPKT